MRKIIGLSLALALLLGVQATGNNHIKNKLAQTKSEVSLKSQAEVQSLADASCPSCNCDLDLEDLDLIVGGAGVGGIPGDGVGTLAESHQNTQVLSSLQASIIPDTTYVQESESLACSTGSSCGK